MKLARLLKKKAFTLVELIIAMAIMMILIVAAMSMFNPVSSIIKSIADGGGGFGSGNHGFHGVFLVCVSSPI